MSQQLNTLTNDGPRKLTSMVCTDSKSCKQLIEGFDWLGAYTTTQTILSSMV